MSRIPSPSLGLRTAMGQLASQQAVVVSTVTLILVAVLVLSVMPRSLEDSSRQDLFETVDEANPILRNLIATRITRYRAVPEDPFALVRDRGAAFATAELSDTVMAVVHDQDLMAESAQFLVRDVPGDERSDRDPTLMRLRHQDSAPDSLEIVSGRLPEPAGRIVLEVECPEADETNCDPLSVPLFEIAVAEPTAVELGTGLGDRLLLEPNAEDQLWGQLSVVQARETRLVVEVVGIFRHGEGELWEADRILYEPNIVYETLDFRFIHTAALMSPDDYRRMAEILNPFGPPWWRYEWRYHVDSRAVVDSDVEKLRRDVASARLANTVTRPGTEATAISTRLPELIDFHNAQRAQTLKVMSLVVAGVFSVVIGAVLTLGVLMTERQQGQIILARDRGASTGQVATTRLYQAILLAVPAAIAAYLLAAALFPQTGGEIAYRASAALTALAVTVSVASVAGLARRSLGSVRLRHAWPRPGDPRRVVFEMLTVIVAASAVALVRRRDPAADPRIDLLLVATPVLVGSAVGLIAMRVVGPVANFLARFFGRRRSAAAFLGFRRVAQQGVAARVPLALLVLCLATAGLSLILLRAVTEGQADGSWQTVGGDYAVGRPGVSTPLPEGLGLGAIEGADVAEATFLAGVTMTSPRTQTLLLVAVDSETHSRILPEAAPDLKSGDEVDLPAIASSRLSVAAGERITVEAGDTEVGILVVAVTERHPGVDEGRTYLIVDRHRLAESAGSVAPPNIAYVGGPPSIEANIRAAVEELPTGVEVMSRYGVLDSVANDPLVRWSGRILHAAWVLAAAVGVLGVAASLAIAASSRQRDFGYLKTLGLTDRQAVAMTLTEQIPGVVIAAGLGLLTGVGVAIGIEPAIDLSLFTGGVLPTVLSIDWWFLGALLGSFLLMLGTAGVILVLVNRRRDLGSALRIGEE